MSLALTTLRTSPGFVLFVLVTLGLFGLLGVMLVQGEVVGSHSHFREHHHRVHDLTFAFLFGTAAVGMAAQLFAPLKNIAGQLMALIPWLGLGVVFPLTEFWAAHGSAFVMIATALFGALTLNAAIFHPAGRDLLRSVHIARADRSMLALVALAAVPLLAFAYANIGLQRSAADDHVDLGHYGFMAAFSLTVIGVGILASLRPVGWRLTAWVAGLLPTLLGIASMVFPDVASSLSPVWALAAIAWGIAFVATAEIASSRAADLLQDRRVLDRAVPREQQHLR
jgi:hypothetical protein